MTIPFAAVGLAKRYVVKPYALKLRSREQAALRSKHAAQVAADKKEARAAQVRRAGEPRRRDAQVNAVQVSGAGERCR